MTKCIYCDFNHPDHIGAEIYSDEYIPEEVMYGGVMGVNMLI